MILGQPSEVEVAGSHLVRGLGLLQRIEFVSLPLNGAKYGQLGHAQYSLINAYAVSLKASAWDSALRCRS